MNINNLLNKAFSEIKETHLKEELEKLGQLRIGSIGCINLGATLASCLRKTYLRRVGVFLDESKSDNRDVMFLGGKQNEEAWKSLLSASSDTLYLKSENEFLIQTPIDKDTVLSGRPDIVIFNKDNNKPELILELKAVSSVYTAVDVLIKGIPKLMHVIQAIHYQYRSGIPVKLYYTSYVDYFLPDNLKQQVSVFLSSEKDDPRVQYIKQYLSFFSEKSTNVKKILPFIIGYEFKIDNKKEKQVYFKQITDDFNNKYHPSVVTLEGIDKYIKQLLTLNNNTKLPEPPKTVDIFGTKANYSLCSYCFLKDVCDKMKAESTLEEFKSTVLKEKSEYILK